MTDSRPIGVFDSGVGGLTVLRAVHDWLPAESTLYVGDVGYFPYGPKPRELVQERSLAIRDYLAHHDVKIIVIACNTATSAAIDIVQSDFDIPVIGVVEPGALAALARSRSKIVGVAATAGTVAAGAYSRALRQADPRSTVHELACGSLVDLVEANQADSDQAATLIKAIVAELAGLKRCDTIILGCTHFPLVRATFECEAGPGVAIVDSAAATAHALGEALIDTNLAAPPGSVPSHSFLVTSRAQGFSSQAKMLFGEHIEAELVEIEPLAVGS